MRSKLSWPGIALMILVLLGALCSAASARGGGGGHSFGGGRSFGGGGHSWGFGGARSTPSAASSGRSLSGASKSIGWGSGKQGAARAEEGVGWGAKSGRTPSATSLPSSASAGKMSDAERQFFLKAKTQGTVFKSRNEAVSTFKKRHSSDYPTSFSTEPAARPAYIPQTTRIGNQDVPVMYNSQYGGYGYYGNTGWRSYNVFGDLVMMSMLMRRDHYYYGSPYGGYGYSPYSQYGYGYGNHFPWVWIVVIGIGLIVVVLVVKWRQSVGL